MKRKLRILTAFSRLAMCLILSGIALRLYAQQSPVVKGQVKDEDNHPLYRATVVARQLNSSDSVTVQTDRIGVFTFNSLKQGVPYSFTVTYIGYDPQTLSGYTFKPGDDVSLLVKLTKISSILDEVVVGYGKLRKRDLTGSVATLKLKEVNQLPITSVEQMVQGRVSGVQVTQNTGAPGGGISFLIRGANSLLGTNGPLIVIDGYPVESGNSTPSIGFSDTFSDAPGGNALSNINPSDIESIEILKDASATAIYGSRGANGVVLITTKRGVSGKEQLEYSFRFDRSAATKQIEMLEARDYMNYINEGSANAGLSPVYTNEDIEKFSTVNYNWQNLVYRTAATQNHQLNISGGTEKLRYAISGNYLNQEGIIKGAAFDRGTIRANLDRQFNDRLKFGLNFSASRSTLHAVPQSSSNGNISGSVVLGAQLSRPIDQPYTEEESPDLAMIGNPATLIDLQKDVTREQNVLTNIFGEYTLLPGLRFRINAGVNDRRNTRQTYAPRGTFQGNGAGGQAYQGETSLFNYLAEYTLNYDKTIAEKHRINAVGGYTWQSWNATGMGVTVRSFPNDQLSYYSLQNGNAAQKPSSSTQNWALASWLARVNYSFDSRYLVTFTGRTDGSTRLAEGKKWKFFPSVAVGWNIKNEKFLSGSNVLSELKLRASYGLSGNQSIAVGSTRARLATISAVVGQSIVTGFTQSSMANDALTWDITSQFDMGADIAFLANKFFLSVDYYRKVTADLLLNIQIPPSTGFSSYATNIGKVENKGFEIEIGARPSVGKLRWEISGNLSVNKNKVLSLGALSRTLGPTFFASGLNQPLHVALPGSQIGAFYGYRIVGIYQNTDEIAAGPSDPARPTPGDFKYADISGPQGKPDGIITPDDRTIIGNPFPDFIFGLSNNFSWKGLTLSVLFQGAIGQDMINLNRLATDALNTSSPSNVRKEAFANRWTGEGTSDTYPKATKTGLLFQGRFSDFIVEDGSFARLKNVVIGYAIPLAGSRFLHTLKIFAAGTNLITLSGYKGYDPEINSKGTNALTPNVDYGSIPQMRTYSVGLTAGF
ncbi:MAG: TonB-dependent receptor [Chitinophagaceae bacterium]|nr:TonB-dependent receptor [Chitinophagaceae bacterium]